MMTRYVLPAVFTLLFHHSFSQLTEPLVFNEKVHDFGTVREESGAAVFEFVLTNKSTRPIKIITVQASCGCTTPGWTKDPIPAGQTGFVKASFDPRGRPGYFDKTLTVTTDWDATPVLLHIKGNVVNTVSEKDPASFTAERGSLKFKANSFNLEKVFINRDPEAISFMFYNSSQDTIHFTGFVGPRYLKMHLPKWVAPHSTAELKILFDAKAKGQYGFVSESVDVNTDDKQMPQKTFSVYATVEEYFPKLSEAELASVPVLSLSVNVVKFGNVKAGTILEREIKLTNTGKNELIIRHAQSNCSCLEVTPGLRVLKPGQETSIKLKLKTEGRVGPQNKSVTIYSTDPKNPVQRITLSAGVF
ncbi:MAG: hypothetical protein OJF59_003077 [Cytophagales bacterium]|nr:DUF1573 domain-containing protein [Bacteroidota bacterium]WHZ09321.1 MAG: hypothetical protein OJF59_003077 [Cytophagales bacterium]